MDLGKGLGHLTYSTLVHPGDDWPQMWDSLTTYVPKVKARIAPKDRFGVSLRLSASIIDAFNIASVEESVFRVQTIRDKPPEAVVLLPVRDDDVRTIFETVAMPPRAGSLGAFGDDDRLDPRRHLTLGQWAND